MPTSDAGGVLRRQQGAPQELPHRAGAGDHRRSRSGFLIRPGSGIHRQQCRGASHPSDGVGVTVIGTPRGQGGRGGLGGGGGVPPGQSYGTRNNPACPAPRYFGTAKHQELIRNAAAFKFAERKAAWWCLGCTPAQQGPRQHWECMHHGQDASDDKRANRVAGLGVTGPTGSLAWA